MIIFTTSGERLSSGRVEAQWEPPDPLPTDAELEDKFVWLVEPVLGEAKVSSSKQMPTISILTVLWFKTMPPCRLPNGSFTSRAFFSLNILFSEQLVQIRPAYPRAKPGLRASGVGWH